MVPRIDEALEEMERNGNGKVGEHGNGEKTAAMGNNPNRRLSLFQVLREKKSVSESIMAEYEAKKEKAAQSKLAMV